jgi:hypothetical protein
VHRIGAVVVGWVVAVVATAVVVAPVGAESGRAVVVTEDSVVVVATDGADRSAVPGIPPLPDCDELRCRRPRPLVPWADLSPDGSRVVYVAHDDGGGGVWVQDVAGGPRQLVGDDTTVLTWPLWSWDGTRIAYEGVDGIVTVAADGSGRTVRPRATVQDVLWDWLPDGDLLYRRSDGCTDELWRTAPDGSRDRQLTAGAVDEMARALHDGRVLLTRSHPTEGGCRGAGGSAFAVVDAGGGEVTEERAVSHDAGVRTTVVPGGAEVLRRTFDPERPGHYRWVRGPVDGPGEEVPVAWTSGAFHVAFAKSLDVPAAGDGDGAAAPQAAAAAAPVPGPAGAVADGAAGGAFVDVVGTEHAGAVAELVDGGIVVGCDTAGRRFCPHDPVTRGQMATLLVRALDLGPTDVDHFDDDAGNAHEGDIDRLAAAGITTGVGERRFDPDGTLTRAQAASMLARAWTLSDPGTRRFGDVGGVHGPAVEAIAEAGIARGCTSEGTAYCPHRQLRRDQAAALVSRALTLPSPS